MKKLLLCPDIGAVFGDVHGEVADQADAKATALGPEARPLSIEQKL